MCKIIAIANQKGGVGKTTTAVNLGIGLVRAGKKVLLIDADSQGSLTASLGYKEPDAISVTLATHLEKIMNEDEYNPRQGILAHDEDVELIPCNIELSGLEVSMVNIMSREFILKEYIEKIKDRYDYIIIDCIKHHLLTHIMMIIIGLHLLCYKVSDYCHMVLEFGMESLDSIIVL